MKIIFKLSSNTLLICSTVMYHNNCKFWQTSLGKQVDSLTAWPASHSFPFCLHLLDTTLNGKTTVQILLIGQLQWILRVFKVYVANDSPIHPFFWLFPLWHLRLTVVVVLLSAGAGVLRPIPTLSEWPSLHLQLSQPMWKRYYYANSEGSGEPSHPCSLARAVLIYNIWK